MLNLQPIANTELSDYAIMLLQNHNIHTVRDFIEAYSNDSSTLMKIINVDEQHITQIVNAMSRLYGPNTTTNLFSDWSTWKTKSRHFTTGIAALDCLLGSQTLQSGSVWEICGASNIGKTQMALSILVNVMMGTGSPALYIDTKLDFSAQRIVEMLKTRNLAPAKQNFLMQQIKVERSLTPHGVLQILQQLLADLQKQSACVHDMCLVIIDSLPAVWYLLEAEQDRKVKKYMLSQLHHLVYKLADQYYLAVIFVNMALPLEQSHELGFEHCFSGNERNQLHQAEILDSDIDDPQYVNQPEGEKQLKTRCLQQVLGTYWQSVPSLRLLLEHASNPKDINKRTIKILKSSYLPSNISCDVHITQEGII